MRLGLLHLSESECIEDRGERTCGCDVYTRHGHDWILPINSSHSCCRIRSSSDPPLTHFAVLCTGYVAFHIHAILYTSLKLFMVTR